MSQFTDFFWPTLERPTPAEVEEDDKSEATDIVAARSGAWTPSPELALEEARRLADSEEDRRRTTEGKASTYLLFAAAFAAALIPFLPGILEGKTGSAPRWLIAIILIIAALYLMAAGVWAFRALRVGTYHRLDVTDLVQIWRSANPTRTLIRETFVVSRRNYRAVNDKVSCIKLVHEFMARSFVAFGVLVVVEAGWEVAHSVSLVGSHYVESVTNVHTNAFQSGVQSSPAALRGSGANLPYSGAKPTLSGPVTSATKPSTKPPPSDSGVTIGPTNSGTNASATSGANGPATSAGSASRGR